jgi:uncharacterized protein with von Willebrand factor type A (vWA) domain
MALNTADSETAGHVSTGLFLSFFYRLRAKGLKVTPDQWLMLVEGLVRGLHGSSLIGFYSLSRSILVKDESEMDDFDQIFAAHFRDIEHFAAAIRDEVMGWLKDPIPPYVVDPAWQKMLDEVDVDALREAFERRLKEQKERHDGGDTWIGTGGVSPFGNSGYHPGGMRVGGERRNGSAVQVAAERRFKAHRRDRVLDTRQFGMALKKLRVLSREGVEDELNIEGTIDRTAREGGEIELVFEPPRENRLSLLLAMDVGGSMERYRRLTELLFSAAHDASHFKQFKYVYFHNCVYEQVYENTYFSEPVPLHDIFRNFDRETRLVLLGDAHMYPGELTQPFGAIHWHDNNEKPGVHYLKQLRDHFKRVAWVNPMPERAWASASVHMVARIFPMYPLTLAGIERLATDLSKG